MKKLLALTICFIMIFSLLPAQAFAASSTLSRESELAEDLKKLGIFKGVSETDFALDRAPTRTEALVMLIRVLGKEADALKKGGHHPFLDVPAWADSYVGYAYENKLTNGISATKFGGGDEASASMFLTFVLRALGYSDTNGDFTWDNPFALARQTGIMKGNPDVIKFLRGDVVLISYAALEAEIKGTGKTLAEKLIEAGAFTAAAYDTYYNVSEFENEGAAVSYNSEEIYTRCSPAVFFIENYDRNGRAISTGSGFFIGSDGTAVTNYHVIEGASSARIYTTKKRWYDIVGVYDYSAEEDWAVIKVDMSNSPYLEISKDEIRGGEQVFAIGSPRGFDNTISEGLISNADRILGGQKFIQISVPISHGSSGGALINKNGKVIGITSGGYDDAQNLNLAIPISIINGYSRKRATPLSAIGEFDDELVVGEIDISGLSEEEAAYRLLLSWIYNYSNATVGGSPAYIVEMESETAWDAGVEYALYYDEEYDCITLMCVYVYADGEGFYTTIDIVPDEEEVFTSYYYFEDINQGGYSSCGVSNAYKRDFAYNSVFPFDKTDGMDYESRSAHIGNASNLFYMSLKFADTLMKETLSGYGVSGIADLGFERFK